MAVNPKIAALLAKARANAARLAPIIEAERDAPTEDQKHSEGTAVVVSTVPAVATNAANVASAVSEVAVIPAQAELIPANPANAVTQVAPTQAQSVELTPQQFLVVEKIARLENCLLASDPQMPHLLRAIHTALHQDPELVHFLEPAQVGVITKAAFTQAKITVVTTSVKKASKTTNKELSALTLADL